MGKMFTKKEKINKILNADYEWQVVDEKLCINTKELFERERKAIEKEKKF
jgi:hypothetical protein